MSKEIAIRAALVIVSILFFSFKAGDISSQFTGDENFYFQSSKCMLESGDWLTPRYYGKPRFQKPFLYYWLIAASFKIFGINWFAARFPSILFAALTVLLVYLMGRIVFKDLGASLLSAIILAATFKFFKYARFAIPDMTLLCFMALSFYIFLRLLKENRSVLWVGFFISLALATLVKGPIGVIIPLLSIAAVRLFSKKSIVAEKRGVILGILSYAVLVFPWFLIMFKVHGAEYMSHIWSREVTHRVLYFSDTKEGMPVVLDYLKALSFYIPIIFIRFLPFSIFLPRGIFNSISLARSGDSVEDRGHLVLLCWFSTVFFLFTLLGEKHSQYMLALSVPFALMVGGGFLRGFEFKRKRLVLPGVIVLVTASSFLLFLSNEDLRLNNAVLGGFATEIIEYGLDEDDRIAAGSHSIIPQQIEAYLDRPVEKAGGRWYDPSYHDRTYKAQLEYFFKRRGGAFCIIRRTDYEEYVSPARKGRLKIIYKDYLWKRKIDLREIGWPSPNLNGIISNFKEEYYLVTNK